MPQRNAKRPSSKWDLLSDGAGGMFHQFCHDWSAKVSPHNPVPDTLEEWLVIRNGRRAWLRKAMGLPPEEPSTASAPPSALCSPQSEVIEVEDRGDYVLEKTLLHSRPNLVMTTHLYVPKDVPKPAPAILSVHGHTGLGKLDPNIQARNIGMTKLGFVVLCVDAIGSGERAYRGETYHGRQLGAQAFPAGLTLAGLQVSDNSRALDYLCSRPEVDANRVACTGASGGCNQTLYLAALDERIAAAAPVCCIGSFEGHLNGPHCVCEMVPGIKRMGEMVDVLSLIAPRPLIIINGIHDGGSGFQITDMRAQFPKLKRVYELLGAGQKVAKCEIDLGHGYFPTMREVMYAWFRRWLMGIEADLCPEPEVNPVEPERVWCFPEGKMPEHYDNVPSLVFHEAQRLKSSYPSPDEISEVRATMLAQIEEEVFGSFPRDAEPVVEGSSAAGLPEGFKGIVVTTEQGIRIPMIVAGHAAASSCLLWLSAEGKAAALARVEETKANSGSDGSPPCQGRPQGIAFPDLRGLGEASWSRSHTVGVWDYQLFQNGTMLGRPVLGMWVWDALQCLRVLRERFLQVSVGGRDVMALVALFASAFDEAVEAVRCERILASYIHPGGFSSDHPMSLFLPNLLKFADVPQLAALIAPRKLHLCGAVDGSSRELAVEEMAGAFRYTMEVYRALGAEGSLSFG